MLSGLTLFRLGAKALVILPFSLWHDSQERRIDRALIAFDFFLGDMT
jgi:hypothetical protein